MTYETIVPGQFRSVMNLITALSSENDQEKVQLYIVDSTGTRQDFERTITVKRE